MSRYWDSNRDICGGIYRLGFIKPFRMPNTKNKMA